MKKWTQEETQYLIFLFNSGKTNKEISVLLNRTYTSIKRKVVKLKLKTVKDWTQDEINIAINLLKEGKNFKEISIELDRTQSAITKKLLREGYKFRDFNVESRLGKIKFSDIDWKLIQDFYTNSNYEEITKRFHLSPKAIMWAQKNGKLKLRTQKEAAQKRIIEGRYQKSNKVGIERYRQECQFKFSLKDYPNEFDFSLIEEHGWYSPSNKGNNLKGVSRDHMYSIREGFDNKVDPNIISHPANCRLVLHQVNQCKNSKSIITLQELELKIKVWNLKYN